MKVEKYKYAVGNASTVISIFAENVNFPNQIGGIYWFFFIIFVFRIKRWKWTREGCELREDTGYEGLCACSVAGIFAITTDMYDVNVRNNNYPNLF